MDDKRRIMVIDDEPRNVKLLGAILQSEGYEIIRAYGGEEALQKVSDETPDLILLDVMMPRMNGYQVTRRLKQDPLTRNIPIILVTALEGIDDKIEGLDAGADEFINKPVNREELLVRVKSLLRLKIYQDELKTKRLRKTSFQLGDPLQNDHNRSDSLPVVLIVEDNEKDIKIIKNYLFGEPYHLKFAKTGEDTLSIAQQENVDVILLDILLPGMNGFQVCQQIKSDEEMKDIQILAITNLVDLKSRVKGFEMGTDDFLVKPINQQELKARVRTLVKKKGYIDNLKAGYERALHSAIIDKLTGLYNYGYLKHYLDQEFKIAERYKTPLSLLMIDVDDFKGINDDFGHLTGDEVLKRIGRLMRTSLREIDLAARYGGEEFSVVLSRTEKAKAEQIAERLREKICLNACTGEAPFPVKNVTVSIGIASWPVDGSTIEDLIESADKALYTAKRSGKNRTCTYYA